MMLGLSASVFANDEGVTSLSQTSTIGAEASAVVTCMQTAVETRDVAISKSVDTYATAAKTAISARTTALKTAWALTDRKERRTAIKTAWMAYKQAIKDARTAFRTAKKTAWDTFKTDSKACKPAKTQDMTNQSVDNNL